MAEKENKKKVRHSTISAAMNEINIRNKKQMLTNIEFPKISKSTRRSSHNKKTFTMIFKTEDEKEKEQKIMNKLLRHAAPADICISALKKDPLERSEELIKLISFYLQMLKNFMSIFKGQIESEELNELLYVMASKLNYENIVKNKFIFKYGDKADKFYIILKGKVTFCVPKINKHYLNEEEFILHLIKLRFHREYNLIKKNMESNKYIYDLGDNFDQFVINSLIRHEKEDEKIYSDKVYSYFKQIKEMIKREKERRNKRKEKEDKEIKYEDMIIEDYLNRTSLDINSSQDDPKKYKRKLLDIYRYEKTNTFEKGDCFGLIGSNNKSNKRSATAITYEDCGLAVLSRDEYNDILNKITKKARERLYNLVSSYKIFTHISKRTFGNKYSHMFRFNRFYFNNILMKDTEVFNKVIMFNSGEFCLFINKNIIELNELIIRMKKIRGKLYNVPEEIIQKDLKEIKENEQYKLNQKYISSVINQYIIKRQNLIISTINDNLMIGYPDTVEPDTFIPLFNCKCISNTSTGYIVEREMINLFKKDYYLRTTPSEAVLLKIDFYLKRLLEHKQNIKKRIEFLEISGKKAKNNYNNNNIIESSIDNSNYIYPEEKNNNDININELNEEENKDETKSDDESFEINKSISRNNINPINSKNANIIEFQKKKINPEIEQYFSPKQEKNCKNHIYLDNNINGIKENDNFYAEISKLKRNINNKKHLLRSIQQRSQKFLEKEKYIIKKIQIKLNKYNYKEKYNDLTTIFSKEPTRKKSILDKYLRKAEDNVLDPAIKDINKQIDLDKKISFLPNIRKTLSNKNDINTIHYSSICNISIDNNLNLKENKLFSKIDNKRCFFDKEDNINYSNGKTINKIKYNSSKKSKKKSLFLSPNDLELIYIKLNYNNLSLDVDENKNNSLRLLSNNFYKDFITNGFNKKCVLKNYDNKNLITEPKNEGKKIDNILSSYHKLDNYKINKFQLMKIKKEREIKQKTFSPENLLNSVNFQNKGISLVDPLALDKFNQIYIKERLNTNVNN